MRPIYFVQIVRRRPHDHAIRILELYNADLQDVTADFAMAWQLKRHFSERSGCEIIVSKSLGYPVEYIAKLFAANRVDASIKSVG